MPKGNKTTKNEPDVTINESANAPKPVTRLKKWSALEISGMNSAWDDDNEDFDIVEEIDDDGVKKLVITKRKKNKKLEQTSIDDRPGIIYPEIIWYFISRYIKPEEIGTFAAINKTTYAITNTESFWRSIYIKYCANSSRLPEVLSLENNCSAYGLRQRVVRALFYTYDTFTKRVLHPESWKKPHHLLKMQCVNMWYSKCQAHWSVCFKFKTFGSFQAFNTDSLDVIEELSRVDVNPEKDKLILQVTCNGFVEVPPPVMGMTLTKLNVFLSQGFRFHRIHLGFNYGPFISHEIQPERFLVFDTVVNIAVLDWWHPKYPVESTILRINKKLDNDEVVPVLKKDFFKS